MASDLIDRHLYGGTIHIQHNPFAKGSSPRYKILDASGAVIEKPRGTTTILGKVLAKDLMGWAVNCAVVELKEKLPIITQADLDMAEKAYTRKRDFGANTGTEAHALVENYLKAHIRGEQPELPDTISPEARNAYMAFMGWFSEQDTVDILNVEEVIYSPSFHFAGTYDCMLAVDGKNYLCDLKTTNSSRAAPIGVYAEYFIQLGAYALAHEEHRQYEEVTKGSSELVKLDDLMVISAKKNGKLDIVKASDVGLTVQECMDMFKRVLSLYNFLSNVTRALGGR